MADLTRDEIREACEAVGWDARSTGGGNTGWLDPCSSTGGFGRVRFTQVRLRSADRSRADAIALLEATGEEYQINRHRDPKDIEEWGEFEVVLGDIARGEPDLTTTAVRAVNQRAKTKKGEG